MHPYTPYLLSDIKAACRREKILNEYESLEEQTLEEHFEEIERWVSGELPEHAFGYFCGLKSSDFPPTKQLSLRDMKLICKAFEKLLYSWNSGIDLPEKLPWPLRYKFMVDTLNQGITIVNSGFMTFGYCSGDAPNCIFKEYCSCLQYWDD